ncbi:hypothetical protein [Streptomyces sp. NPDC001415]
MSRVFKFRFHGKMAGLAANLTAEAGPLETLPKGAMQVHRKVWVSLPDSGLHWKDAAWLAFGVSANARELDALFPQGLHIKVLSLEFPLSDYRAEVAACTMDGWLHEEFELSSSGITASFDPVSGRAYFNWGETPEPFSDQMT